MPKTLWSSLIPIDKNKIKTLSKIKSYDKVDEIVQFETIDNVTNEVNIITSDNDHEISRASEIVLLTQRKMIKLMMKTIVSCQVIIFRTPNQIKCHFPSIFILHSMTLKAKINMMKCR